MWQPCGGRALDRRLCGLGGAWGAPLAGTGGCEYAGASGRRHHGRRGFLEHARERRAHVLGALEAGAWEQLSHQRRLADGSVLAWVGPTRPGDAKYPLRRGMWVRIISYRLTDERLGEVGKVYRLGTTLLNPRVAPALKLIALYHERS